MLGVNNQVELVFNRVEAANHLLLQGDSLAKLTRTRDCVTIHHLFGLEYVQQRAMGRLNGQQDAVVSGNLRLHRRICGQIRGLEVVVSHIRVFQVTFIPFQTVFLGFQLTDQIVQLALHRSQLLRVQLCPLIALLQVLVYLKRRFRGFSRVI